MLPGLGLGSGRAVAAKCRNASTDSIPAQYAGSPSAETRFPRCFKEQTPRAPLAIDTNEGSELLREVREELAKAREECRGPPQQDDSTSNCIIHNAIEASTKQYVCTL